MIKVIKENMNDEPMSKREMQWFEFSLAVMDHLKKYTVPQYGDVGEDEITNYTVKDCVNHLSRYAKRYGSQSRANQQLLDFVKIAHYAQCAWEKEKNKEIIMEPELDKLIMSRSHEDDEKLISTGHVLIGTTFDEDDNEIFIWRSK